MKSTKNFEDGSSLSWKDKETLEYIEGDFILLIWVDFMPGLFSTGRILKLESISEWTSHPEGLKTTISDEKREEIKSKVFAYYKERKRKCVAE